MTEKTKDNFYSTRDIELAATLLTLKFPMTNIDYQIEGDKLVGYFGFEENEDLYKTIKKYREDDIVVEPKSNFSNLKYLKSETNNSRRNPHGKF